MPGYDVGEYCLPVTSHCPVGTVCPDHGGDSFCELQPGLGEPCGQLDFITPIQGRWCDSPNYCSYRTLKCAPGLYCNDDNVCVPRPDVDEPCSDSIICRDGLVCANLTTDGTCTPSN